MTEKKVRAELKLDLSKHSFCCASLKLRCIYRLTNKGSDNGGIKGFSHIGMVLFLKRKKLINKKNTKR